MKEKQDCHWKSVAPAPPPPSTPSDMKWRIPRFLCRIKSNQVYSLNLVSRHVRYVRYMWCIYTLSFVYQEGIQWNYNIFLISVNILNDNLYDLDTFSDLVPLAFITWLKVKIKGCVNKRLPSNNSLLSKERTFYYIMELVTHFRIFKQGVYDFDI